MRMQSHLFQSFAPFRCIQADDGCARDDDDDDDGGALKCVERKTGLLT